MTPSASLHQATTALSPSDSASLKTIHHQIVIIGGGAAGVTTAAQLLNQNPSLDIAIIEPSETHYYQPAWTLVGGGQFRFEDTARPEQDYIPARSKWIQDWVIRIDPDHNALFTRNHLRVEYDYLIVCPGIQIDWHLIDGLADALGKGGVTSNYSPLYVTYTWEVMQTFKGGNALFTFPSTPIKCGGAPQKIMYLADDYFKSRSGVGVNTQMFYCSAAAKMFPVPAYCKSLDAVVAEREIQTKFLHNLKAIRPETQEAVFAVTTPDGTEEVSLHYDMIHVVPPMSAPDFIKHSPLAVPDAPGGWVDVNKTTLQHNRYPNVFSLGDASSLPVSKTAAAIRKQAPVLVANLLGAIASNPLQHHYNGYTCCPLITGYHKTIMAEFDYTNTPTPSFPLDPTQERWSMWLVKKHVLPWLYWNRMLKGSAFEADQLKSLTGAKK